MTRILLFGLTSSLVLGCGGGDVAPDAGGGLDGGRADAGTLPADAGVRDAGETDAGETDAGETDAGETDAGALDAGALDAGDTDAGETDAGALDAGGGDAGACAPMDAMEGTPCGPTERPFPRYRWTGTTCELAAWCRCLGPDCDALFNSEAECRRAYDACLAPCRTDADCARGAQWCEEGRCVECDNSGLVCLIRCPHGWTTYQRNGCSPCECAPANDCEADRDCGAREHCYAGAFCWCPGGGRSPECCRGNVCAIAGCPEPPPTGCVTRGCPRGEACVVDASACAPSGCTCSGAGAWSCTRDCGGGTCVAP
ncbi:MAG: hypothetical protein KF729_24190 [Sandaracinaceae bacterium]|nr:hypothetical protein [Sandaracinaceae bacterium]